MPGSALEEELGKSPAAHGFDDERRALIRIQPVSSSPNVRAGMSPSGLDRTSDSRCGGLRAHLVGGGMSARCSHPGENGRSIHELMGIGALDLSAIPGVIPERASRACRARSRGSRAGRCPAVRRVGPSSVGCCTSASHRDIDGGFEAGATRLRLCGRLRRPLKAGSFTARPRARRRAGPAGKRWGYRRGLVRHAASSGADRAPDLSGVRGRGLEGIRLP